jgi:acyl-ACP thioesterase
MKCRMSKEYIIGPGACDHSSRLGIPDTFGIFMDMAAEHAESLGIGTTFMMKEHKFWLTAKTRIKFMRRPYMMEKVRLDTWPLMPRGIQEIRDYSITDMNGSIIALGKTQWAVLDTDTGSLVKIQELFDDDWDLETEAVLDEPFARVAEDTSDCEEAGKYEIRSIDIDLGGHMNNAAYVKALFSIFTTSELDAMKITDCEICYKHSCYEGDTLTFYKRQRDNAIEMIGKTGDGETAMLAVLK